MASTAAAKPFRDRAYDAAMTLMGPLERMVMRSSLVPVTPYLDVEHFPWARELEEQWGVIREELEGVLVYQDDLPAFHELAADVSVIAHDGWKTFFFCGYGFRADGNCARCPRTAALLDRIPGLTTAFFSILPPGARLPPHRGPWGGVIRYHLGLIVPAPDACGISVDGRIAHWAEGRSLVFDDSYEHTAWNESGAVRVVLFLDVLRPCRLPGSFVNRAVVGIAGHSPFLQDAKRRYLAWERRFTELHPVPDSFGQNS
jgi:aspartyl/asparaginyl beta-hydroxylase (cupin superfamily)